jgi:hypothetical protein
MLEVQTYELDARFSALLSNGFRLFSVVGFLWLHHIPSLDVVAIGTKACNLPNAVRLY